METPFDILRRGSGRFGGGDDALCVGILRLQKILRKNQSKDGLAVYVVYGK
jgi:hypothetical protein